MVKTKNMGNKKVVFCESGDTSVVVKMENKKLRIKNKLVAEKILKKWEMKSYLW